MSEQHSEMVMEIMRLITDGASQEEVVAKARVVKQEHTEKANALLRANTMLDNLIMFTYPDVPWQPGFNFPPVAVPAGTVIPDRARRTLEIANAIVGGGASTVRTKDVADQLRTEGDPLAPNNLATAIGNILTRTGGWRRVRSGEYERASEDVGA